TAAAPPAATPTHTSTAPPLPHGVARPPWLGTRPLPLGPDGEALPQPTPPELVVRRIPTIDLLPPPPPGAPFASTIEPLSDEVVARSTWTPECPVGRDDLRYVTVSFWGFDERPHTGEMIVHASWAEEVVDIFGQLFDARYPIEEMRIVSAEELDGTPTGDGNDTTAFVCRPTRGSTNWSQHAYGLAVDVNPFINPYRRGDRILPELAGAYLDRAHERPGMLDETSVAVRAFDAIGWGWGGRWSSLIDYMHFSANGR
ncbi:M15 family metallopeptidase, partial [Euzebya sp.]|uniref:M15 family metallopeptidase n=1 Tax=Euzebya sp. TaxID=1971409 RepID=UPI003512F146